ncbi:hypothetical protein RJ639_035249 [Escallonia herrerae]|uniref:non-specific serine/threonine protein kinase n=1 Tax=Escallonia herrerae TaxID=1293975 RepID=A0AA88WUN9_9ASTE|nr:hypothetical protein RJ639_035249 [Escallonia herrerae]
MAAFLSNQLPVDSVSLSNPTIDIYSYLQFTLQVFPSGQENFNRTGVSTIGSLLNRQPFRLERENKSANIGVIAGTIGATIASCVLVFLFLCAGVYVFRRKQRGKRANERNNPFATWEQDRSNGSIPQLKGARFFLFEELRKYTNNFSEGNSIGVGGYGKVYRGSLPTGELVAIKRAQQGSLQGALEFKTEIELLSRIHHKNVVSLVGFYYGQGEQILVYEYISNGTLKENLSGKSGSRWDWMRRLSVALDSAKGLAYLHELANPPIIHRDIKSTNILLDDHLTAKVADFGLSKLIGDSEKDYVSTQVKGTLGYMDPEYYMTQQLTDKSDVYSFGVVLLELLTARAPIQQGRHIVREVKETMDRSKDQYNLDEIVDPNLGLSPILGGLEKFVDLAMSCVRDSGADRPTMGEVVREIESIMELARPNSSKESPLNSSSSHEGNKHHPYHSETVSDYSGSGFFFPFETEVR